VLPRPSLLLAVFVGGCAGGLARYTVTSGSTGVPWSTLWVNASGAFLLALLLVVALEVLPQSTYVRPLLGSGFCGAWTTFSGIVVPASTLTRDGRALAALGYLGASVLGGLAAAVAGLLLGRFVVGMRSS
jgi:CrcB protein